MYCDFNPRLFKEFVSKGAKIKPQMADDWEMIPTAHVKIGGFSLKSTKLNQEVADISLMRFLKFCKMENLIIEGLKLKGNFIIGNDRSVYTEKTYGEWKDKFESRTETIINKKDYIPGHKYKTPCGAELIYLGEKYISKIKSSRLKTKEFNEFTNIQKKSLIISQDGLKDDYYKKSSYHCSELKQKFTVDLGLVLNNEKIQEILNYYLAFHTDVVCFEDTKPKNPEFGLVECDVLKTNTYQGTDYYEGALIVKAGNAIYHTENYYRVSSLIKKGNTYNTGYWCDLFDINKMITERCSRQENSDRNLDVIQTYRIGIIK